MTLAEERWLHDNLRGRWAAMPLRCEWDYEGRPVMGATKHTTATGCEVRVRAVGPSVEVVITQRDGRSATYAAGWEDALAVATLMIAAANATGERT